MVSRVQYSQADIQKIGIRIKELRKLRNYSQRALAEEVAQKKDVIQRLESGKLKSIDEKLLTSIAYHLDCNVDYLLLRSSDSEKPKARKTHFLELPEFQKEAEGFIFSNMDLRMALSYAAMYMNPYFQKQLIDVINTLVTYHKCAVDYPNITPQEAQAVTPDFLTKKIEDSFFKKMLK